MKLTKIILATVIGTVGVIYCAQAQDSSVSTNDDNSTDLTKFYRSQEISFDVFGSGSVGQSTIDHITGQKVEHNGRLGAGGGVNVFFCRYLGIGGDAYSENTFHSFINSASGNLIARIPISDTGIAPYIYGGAGHQFKEVEQTFAQFGGGCEFRFMKHAGFFADARYVIPTQTGNYGVGRAGIRVNF